MVGEYLFSTTTERSETIKLPYIITDAMLKEEKKIEAENAKEMEKLRRQCELEKRNEEEKEKRYKRLLNLLERSQTYARFVKSRMNAAELEELEFNLNEKKRKRNQKENVDAEEVKKRSKGISDNKILMDHNNTSNSQVPCKINEKTDIADSLKTKITSLGIEVPIEQPNFLQGACLRKYQLHGFEWLKLLYEEGLNGILADEMGLGKTVQSIALVCHLYEQNVPGPYLIVAPLSTLPNWMNEYEMFAPQIPVLLYHGTRQERSAILQKIRKIHQFDTGQRGLPVVVTSYEVVNRDCSSLMKFDWKYVIVDEGHRIKNFNSLLFQSLRKLNTDNRLLLTGTPIQNNLRELWSLLHFLLPDVFKTLDSFETWFQVKDIEKPGMAEELIKQEREKHVLSLLHEILSPFLLRRVKNDIEIKLPLKKEIQVNCPMSKEQTLLYKAALDKTIENVAKSREKEVLIIPDNRDGTKVKRQSRKKINYSENDSHKNSQEITFNEEIKGNEDEITVPLGEGHKFKVKTSNILMMLKQISAHPYLIKKPVLPGSDELIIDDRLITSSGKMIFLDQLLEKLHEGGHKVLLFSTLVIMLDLLEDYLEMKGYKSVRLDGMTKLDERRAEIYDFNTKPDVFVFLLSTRAGGLGINLTAADTVILFDSDWNPQCDLQAQDRCHRIGQTKPVIVYRLVTPGTVDEKIVSRASAKRKLEQLVIQQGHFKYKSGVPSNTTGNRVELEEIRELLNKKLSGLEINTLVMKEEQWAALLDRTEFNNYEHTISIG